MVPERDRHELYVVLEERLGSGPAGTLMAMLPPVEWDDIARGSDIREVRGEIAELRGEMAELRGELRELKGEVRGDIARLHARIDGLLPRLYAANVASTVAIAGLVFTIARAT